MLYSRYSTSANSSHYNSIIFRFVSDSGHTAKYQDHVVENQIFNIESIPMMLQSIMIILWNISEHVVKHAYGSCCKDTYSGTK